MQLARAVVEPSVGTPGYSQPQNSLRWQVPSAGALQHTARIRWMCSAPSHKRKEPRLMPAPAHHGQSGARARQKQQEAAGGKGGNHRQPWLMEVPWGHHSTAQPGISSEKQK